MAALSQEDARKMFWWLIGSAAGELHGAWVGRAFQSIPVEAAFVFVLVLFSSFVLADRTLKWTELTSRYISGVSVQCVHKCAGYEVLLSKSWMFLNWAEIQSAALLFCSSICISTCFTVQKCPVLSCAIWCHMLFPRLVMHTYRTTYNHSTVTRNLTTHASSPWKKEPQVFIPYYCFPFEVDLHKILSGDRVQICVWWLAWVHNIRNS